MSSRNLNDSPPLTQELHSLCTNHLQYEATVLASALLLVQAMEAAFQRRSGSDFVTTIQRHAEVAALMEELNGHRACFRAAAARSLGTSPEAITIPVVLDRLPPQDRPALATGVARVRLMAEELAANNRRVSICLRIHLDAYQRILRDLTSSRQGSGRYGRTGRAESHEYRPLIQIHG